jgi:hypothetical protein
MEVFPVTQCLIHLYALTVSLSNFTHELTGHVHPYTTCPSTHARSDIMDELLGHLFPQLLCSPFRLPKPDRAKTLLPAGPARPQTTVDLPFSFLGFKKNKENNLLRPNKANEVALSEG